MNISVSGLEKGLRMPITNWGFNQEKPQLGRKEKSQWKVKYFLTT